MFSAPGGVGCHTTLKTEPAEMEVYNIQRTSEGSCPELVTAYFSENEGFRGPYYFHLARLFMLLQIQSKWPE